MASLFSRSRAANVVATLAAGGLTAGLYARHVLNNPVYADDGSPPKTFKGGPAFLSLPLESAEMVNHNTKKLRFKLPSDQHVSGLPLTSSVLTMSWPKGSWTPVARPYTPITSADEPGYMEFLIKHYPGGKQSTHLHSLNPGEKLLFAASLKGPQWKPKSSPEHITLVAGGAGITPVYQLAQGILHDPASTQTSMTLVFGVNGDQDVLLRDELRGWEKEFPGRFKAIYTVSKPSEGSPYPKGYVTKELLNEVVPEKERGRVFVCGPPSMESSLVGTRGKPGILEQLGYKKDEIQKF